jgi:hypothetical protein
MCESASRLANHLGRTVDGVHSGRERRDELAQVPGPASEVAHHLRRNVGGTFYVQDLGSSGGTLVNDSPVTGPRELRPGDVVSFGRVHLRFDAATGSH